jgi:hypothetical protein
MFPFMVTKHNAMKHTDTSEANVKILQTSALDESEWSTSSSYILSFLEKGTTNRVLGDLQSLLGTMEREKSQCFNWHLNANCPSCI